MECFSLSVFKFHSFALIPPGIVFLLVNREKPNPQEKLSLLFMLLNTINKRLIDLLESYAD